MKQRITEFNIDDEGDWRAALECGHFQHVRHAPPLTTRSWVLTVEGRSSRIGLELDCKRCDENSEVDSELVVDCEGLRASSVILRKASIKTHQNPGQKLTV